MSKKEIQSIYLKKIKQIKKYDKAYFKHDQPLISDSNYDILKKEILDLEKKYKHLKHGDSPSQKLGYKPSEKFKKVDHEVPMLSLSNAFSVDDIENFIFDFEQIYSWIPRGIIQILILPNSVL